MATISPKILNPIQNNNIAEPSEKQVDEIFYHVFQRSFFDSDGDRHGDFRGLKSKLNYIEDLGVTSILILPIYNSIFYHNYFATDFREIDPKYGTMDDYLALIRDIQNRGMKLYLDMEVQYVTEDHLWYKDSYNNPKSPYSEHIIYNGPNNTDPESIIFDLKEIHSYDGTVKKVACLNIFNPNTQEKLYEEFKFWTDPHGDGSLRDGVDGFRLDHMMDDLDDKGKLVGVYSKFWKPLIHKVKAINPNIKFIGEQADWESHGSKGFNEADVDYMFAFPLKFAMSNFNKGEIIWTQQKGIEDTPRGKDQIILLENHDTTRFASFMHGDPSKLRVGAALNILLKGKPSIYYGQELGMEGLGGFAMYGLSDGNDIPRRESFPWKASKEFKGNTLWYKDSGPWWDDSKLADNNGVSVEEQINDPDSLLNFYKKLIRIRSVYKAIQFGQLDFLPLGNDYVISFVRTYLRSRILVNISLSAEYQIINLPNDLERNLIFTYPEKIEHFRKIPPYGIQIFELPNVESGFIFESE